MNDIIIGNFDIELIPTNENRNMGNLVLKKEGNVTVVVKSREGFSVPHFHIIYNGTSLETCICIYENKFFNHNNHTSKILMNQNCRLLDEWLSSRYTGSYFPKDSVYTNWEAIEQVYRDTNGSKYQKGEKSKPDYTTILPYN